MRLVAALFLVLILSAWAADDKTVPVPDFSVAVRLSPQAETRLHNLHESIIVGAYFDGDGEAEPGVDTAPFRAVFLGEVEKEVNDKNVVEFKGEKVSEKAWKRLSDKNYFVILNIFSARKVLRNNILLCGAPENHIESVRGKTLEVHCSLIGEVLK